MPVVHLLNYVAGNVRSLVNAIEKVGYTVEWITSPEEVERAEVKHCLSTMIFKALMLCKSALYYPELATSATA